MLPVEIFDLSFSQSGQLGVDVTLVAPLVVPLLPEEESYAKNEDQRRGGQIQTIADRIIWSIEGKDCKGHRPSKSSVLPCIRP